MYICPVFKLDYIIKYNKYENGKSILDILGMSLFQTTLSDFLEGFKFRMQKGGERRSQAGGDFFK